MRSPKSDRHLDPYLSCFEVFGTPHIAFNEGNVRSHSQQLMRSVWLLQVFWKIWESRGSFLKKDHTYSVIPFRAEITHENKAVILAQTHTGFALCVTLQCSFSFWAVLHKYCCLSISEAQTNHQPTNQNCLETWFAVSPAVCKNSLADGKPSLHNPCIFWIMKSRKLYIIILTPL